jgi:hypothetical protein
VKFSKVMKHVLNERVETVPRDNRRIDRPQWTNVHLL